MSSIPQSDKAQPPITIFTAKKIVTMDDSLPYATAVAVSEGRILAVGTLESMAPWCEGREVQFNKQFEGNVLLPGLIDNHVHPWLGALLLPTMIIAPESWTMPDGKIIPAALNREQWFERLREAIAADSGESELLASWGFHRMWHGSNPRRSELDALCPDRPLIIWNRSFHEIFANTQALKFTGLTREAAAHPQVNWDEGHFFETGNKVILLKLLPYFLRKEWFNAGLTTLVDLMHRGGITTIADMGFGSLSVDYEMSAWDEVVGQQKKPIRVFNVPHAGALGFRLSGQLPNPAKDPGFEKVLDFIEPLPSRDTASMKTLRGVKLFADGGFFNLMMRLNPPGYIDGSQGQWMMSPEVIAKGIQVFWDAGYQIHVHVNGDQGMDAVLDGLAQALNRKPRYDHRFTVHHVGFCSAAQVRRMAAMNVIASVNPYHIHALSDNYSLFGLGPERAAQMVRLGSMTRAGMSVSFHSDFMMAPTEPLFLAWCAATRQSQSGKVGAPTECLSLHQVLRGITIDAAHAIGLDHDIGSIVAGKKADFTVLEQDPESVGVMGLKDIKIWGTVFEGGVYPVACPAVNAHEARAVLASSNKKRDLHAMQASCCAVTDDRCDTAYRLARWIGDFINGGLQGATVKNV